ncbi:MAG: alanine racemase [Bacteroidales bacterium]|nr:alanine racemase [Bacteroidales bacterium]
MLHTSFIELNPEALQNNIRYMRDHMAKGARYSMVIKGNAYGHGIENIIPMAEACDVDHFSVFSVSEAIRARKTASAETEIMIMGWIDREEIEWAIQNDVSFYVFTFDRLTAACNTAKRLKKSASIHLELETGMHRTGFNGKELDKVLHYLARNRKHLYVEGICTHYAGAESINNYSRIREQIDTFNSLVNKSINEGVVPKYRHTACSAAVLRYPETIMDLVRVGIANYGFWPSEELRMNHFIDSEKKGVPPTDPLDRVLAWKSTVMSVNVVPAGEYISYGKSYLTNRDTTIATVPVGYGYGYARTLSNMGHVLLHGKRVKVIGSVNMNMMVIDVTDVKKPKIGDEVVLIGKQGDLNISVSSFGDMTNSLNYELLTRLPGHIPRHISE